jgi:membrane protease YdiL (CAAX protease family)
VDLWLLVIILIAGLPALAYWRFTRIARRHEPATTAVKLRLYLTGIATQWCLVIYCIWVLARRGLSLRDIGWVGGAHPIVWALAVLFTAALVFVTYRSIQGLEEEDASELPLHLKRLLRILPTNRIERAAFVALALTAGFCEEILYRGFLIYALSLVMPHVAIAVVLAGVAFGIGHAYQGRQGMLTTGALGVVLGILFIAGRSLWPVIFIHAVIDLANGYTLGEFARRLQRRGPLPPEIPLQRIGPVPGDVEPPPPAPDQGEEAGRFDGGSTPGP